MVEEVFLFASDVVTAGDVVNHFYPALRGEAMEVVRSRPGEQWQSDESRAALLESLRRTGNAVAFACGVELLAPFELVIDSPTLRAARRETLRLERVRQVGEMLREFEQLRLRHPDLKAGQLLSQYEQRDRGVLLCALLSESAGRARTGTLWAVGGMGAVRLDLRDETRGPEKRDLPDTLGPLRSVQITELGGSQKLLAGARGGVWVMDMEDGREPRAYADEACRSARGFSRAVSWGGGLWACHGERGIVAWDWQEGTTPRRVAIEEPGNLCVLDESRLLVSCRGKVLVVGREGQVKEAAESGAAVVAICPVEQGVIVVREDGEVSWCERENLRVERRERWCGKMTAAAVMPWLDDVRVLLATEEGLVYCAGLEDGVVTQYAGGRGGLRRVVASADWMAGVSSSRGEVLLWESEGEKKSAREIHLAAMLGHRVADVALGD